LLALLAACKTVGPDPNRAIAPTAAKPAEGALVATGPNLPPVGAKWTFSTDGSQVAFERLPNGTLGGRAVAKLQGADGEVSQFDLATANWVATMDRSGNKPRSADPDSGNSNWPMFAGKEWTAVATYHDHTQNRAWAGRTTYWKVEAEEEVAVPAGTFKTLRLQSQPGRGDGTLTTLWYAPDIGLNVKRHNQRTSSHYRGASDRRERVLVSYEPPPAR
jgi:hypothetical protein